MLLREIVLSFRGPRLDGAAPSECANVMTSRHSILAQTRPGDPSPLSIATHRWQGSMQGSQPDLARTYSWNLPVCAELTFLQLVLRAAHVPLGFPG